MSEEKKIGISNSDRAHVLVQAMPYIKKWAGETIVVKYGGNAMINPELKEAVMNDIVLMQLVGVNVVLVHGGGPEISGMLKKIGKESRFVGGMRYTDAETMDIVQQVLAGKVNKDLVQLLENTGGKAVGLCGLDGSMLKADKLPAAEDLGFVGEIREVSTKIVEDVIASGYTPVISTVAAGYHGEVYNINADVAAARIAAELGARKLILMTDIVGLLRDKDDENTLIPVVNVSDVPKLKRDGIISGGMIPKIDCCVEAVRRGVERAHIIDGRTPHSILVELFTDDVLQIIADIALAHGHAHRKRHDVTLGLLLVVGGEGVLDHANLRAVAVGDDDLVAVLNEVGDGFGRHMDGIHLLMQILAKGVAAQRNDDTFSHS